MIWQGGQNLFPVGYASYHLYTVFGAGPLGVQKRSEPGPNRVPRRSRAGPIGSGWVPLGPWRVPEAVPFYVLDDHLNPYPHCGIVRYRLGDVKRIFGDFLKVERALVCEIASDFWGDAGNGAGCPLNGDVHLRCDLTGA